MKYEEYRRFRLLERAAVEAGRKLGFNGDPLKLQQPKVGTYQQFFFNSQAVFFEMPPEIRHFDKDTAWLMANSIVMDHDESRDSPPDDPAKPPTNAKRASAIDRANQKAVAQRVQKQRRQR